ncbi:MULTISPECIES: hypothetical protein [Planococcus]|uniref:YesK-like protein n=2 Tax=Planococcus TaxID=1372 RepID=A0ABM5WW44_9BACL|nr:MULTISPECIES: hypothetical protein [Planococcus]ALS78550.1 hypothetical protein AUO94_07695 [Planococcus kocurii]AQU79465.1 hypothetical protein AJGP001_09420 [Planococcus faecalis]KAA0956426.1 hypothetical protein FQ085_13055 [Planococcus sp. ANT_H30]MDJ0332545.1 hypothetical protein [Planococcus sp. S3-L1]OHX51432.1 hypothetical protein BB777_04005 [Planococcus faecalis]
MGNFLLISIIAVAIFVGIASKKFYDKPYIMNFGIAVMMALLVIQTFQMTPIGGLGYAAIILCSIAFLFQVVIGIRNLKTVE